MKRRLFLLHSWLGLIAGLGLVVIGLTGSLLVFRDDVDVLLAPDQVLVRQENMPRMSFDTLLHHAEQAMPGSVITGWEPAREPGRADKVWLVEKGGTDWRFVWMNPFTGAIQSEAAHGHETLTGWLLELHYAFLADHAGLFFAGGFALLLCLLGVTGVWLYRDFWKNLLTLRWRRGMRIFCSDLHKMVGITTVVFNLLLGFTGAWWNFSHLIGHMIEEEAEPEPLRQKLLAVDVSLDAVVAEAKTALPGYEPGYFSMPLTAEADLTLYGRLAGHGPLRSDYGSTVGFDAKSGALKQASDISQAGIGRQMLDAFAPLHFGSFGGLPVKLLWCLCGLAPGLLAVTGSMLWLRRRGFLRGSSRPKPARALPENGMREPRKV